MVKSCAHCGAKYEAKRATSRFCSGTCRTRSHLGKRGGSPAPVTIEPPSAAEIEAALADPRRGLATIASDPLAPLAVRVSAYKALMTGAPKAAPVAETENDRINRIAIAAMNAPSSGKWN
jgi:hypothetical protein